jgi:hypothetical protein
MLATVTRRLLAVATAMSAVVLMSLPAIAAPITLFTADDFYIPRPASASDQVGVPRLLISFDVAANGFGELIGQTCQFTISAANGTSVHLNNYGILNTGADSNNSSDILETESLPDVITTTLTDETLTIGPVITLSNVMLPDPNGTVGTSVDYVVIVDCDIDDTTTTTVDDDTTTTAGDTTTTAGDTTTTTAEETTTTTVVEVTTTTSGVTTTVFGEDTTTTTTSGSTTSSSVVGSTTSSVPPVTGSTLPFTGPPVEAAGILMAGTALLMLGGGVLLAAKRG